MTFRVMIGIDPGTTGSYAIFYDGELDKVARLPMYNRPATKTRKGGRELQMMDLLSEFTRIICQNQGATFTAVIEQVGVNAMGPVGMTSLAKLVAIAHAIEGMLFAKGIGIEWVQPKLWKQFHGLKGSDKQHSIDKAKSMYPWLELNTKVSADLAEAVLIGAYGVHRYGE